MSISPRGMSVQEAYRLYRENQLVVNRKYQRKLVWTLPEKQALIESINLEYPIPLFLLAEKTNASGQTIYEIIDGMQRLHTIFSFIENNFKAKDLFFNLNEFPRAKQYAQDGLFTEAPLSEPRLGRKECASFLDYQLAVTMYPQVGDELITEVFSRINAYGRQLSPQEKRQAGFLTLFSETVRTLASEIRGDITADRLLLSQMPEISIDSKTIKLSYGIKAEDVFWVQQGIMNANQLRKSEDEQFIADICASIVSDTPFPASSETFDDLYDTDNPLCQEIERQLVSYSPERLKEEIKTVFSSIIDFIKSGGNKQNYLRTIFRDGGSGNPAKTEFYAFFMAYFDLTIKQKLTPFDFQKIEAALKNVSENMKQGTHYVTSEDRRTNINIIKGLISDFFVKREPPLLHHGPGLFLDFVNSLRRSRIESPQYEFKQGILRLDENRKIDDPLIDHIINTICGIANVGPGTQGFIFLGVADKEADAKRIIELDKIEPVKIENFFVVGVDREAKVLGKKLDTYVSFLVDKIKTSQLSDHLKTHVLTRIDTVTVRDFSVIRIVVPPQKSVSFVGSKVYAREGSSTKEASGPMIVSITNLFK